VFLVLGVTYAGWLLTFWPGVLGEDSIAVLLELQSDGTLPSGKPAFWHYFVKVAFQPTGLVEVPVGFQLLLAALVFSRILGWCWVHGLKKTALFLAVFICLAPHMIFFIGSLYADGIYAVAGAGLLFELWLIARARQVTAPSLAFIAIELPFAVFMRTNGLILLAAVVYVAILLKGAGRLKFLAVNAIWCAVAAAGVAAHNGGSHGVLYPLALFESVNFLQPRPMNLWREKPRISQETIEALTRHQPLPKIVANYDRDYWDPLVHWPNGPHLGGLSPADQEIIVREFFRYNLWQNIPAFAASRVNIFLVSTLAQGGLVSLEYAPHVLAQVRTRSEFRRFHLDNLASMLTAVHAWSERYRWLLWSPLLGIALLFVMAHRGVRTANPSLLVVALPMLAQLLGIVLFSIAGEYRYLLPYFTLPLVALPALAAAEQ
jgi:hypothetical protein